MLSSGFEVAFLCHLYKYLLAIYLLSIPPWKTRHIYVLLDWLDTARHVYYWIGNTYFFSFSGIARYKLVLVYYSIFSRFTPVKLSSGFLSFLPRTSFKLLNATSMNHFCLLIKVSHFHSHSVIPFFLYTLSPACVEIFKGNIFSMVPAQNQVSLYFSMSLVIFVNLDKNKIPVILII